MRRVWFSCSLGLFALFIFQIALARNSSTLLDEKKQDSIQEIVVFYTTYSEDLLKPLAGYRQLDDQVLNELNLRILSLVVEHAQKRGYEVSIWPNGTYRHGYYLTSNLSSGGSPCNLNDALGQRLEDESREEEERQSDNAVNVALLSAGFCVDRSVLEKGEPLVYGKWKLHLSAVAQIYLRRPGKKLRVIWGNTSSICSWTQLEPEGRQHPNNKADEQGAQKLMDCLSGTIADLFSELPPAAKKKLK